MGDEGWFAGIFAPPKPVANWVVPDQHDERNGALLANLTALILSVHDGLDWLISRRQSDAADAAVLRRRAAVVAAPYDPLHGQPGRSGPWNAVLPNGPSGRPARMSVRANAAAASAHAIATAAFRRREGTAFDVGGAPIRR